MRLHRDGRQRIALALIAATSVVVAIGGRAGADTASDTHAADSTGSSEETEDAGSDATTPAASVTEPPQPLVELAGGVTGSLAPFGEAWTTWRYGRTKGNLPLDETTTRLRVSGAGRAFDGLMVGFSVGLLAPSLATGVCVPTTRAAAVWARHDRIDVSPDLEWDSSVASAGRSTLSLTIASVEELSRTSERQGAVTVDVTHFRVHGTLEASLPCTKSGPTFRQSCQTETLHGTF